VERPDAIVQAVDPTKATGGIDQFNPGAGASFQQRAPSVGVGLVPRFEIDVDAVDDPTLPASHSTQQSFRFRTRCGVSQIRRSGSAPLRRTARSLHSCRELSTAPRPLPLGPRPASPAGCRVPL
jgi:hypothetical protein